MAKMIPDDVTHSEFHGSIGEENVYSALKALPKEYIVFHSVHWQKKVQGGRISWGESDFAVFHPKRGLLVMSGVHYGGTIPYRRQLISRCLSLPGNKKALYFYDAFVLLGRW